MNSKTCANLHRNCYYAMLFSLMNWSETKYANYVKGARKILDSLSGSEEAVAKRICEKAFEQAQKDYKEQWSKRDPSKRRRR